MFENLLDPRKVKKVQLSKQLEHVLFISNNYKDAPCLTALLGELEEDSVCFCPTCGHRAVIATLEG